MFKKITYGLAIAASLAGSPLKSAPANENTCLTLGGTALAQAVDTTRFIGALTGSFSGSARAEVLEEKKHQPASH